ncbi:MAG: hypothetical protein KBT10_02320 [Bacteroidales bacterium]|nr:hypothetical protein [Candidatus Sodaliphilus aphodohippi]
MPIDLNEGLEQEPIIDNPIEEVNELETETEVSAQGLSVEEQSDPNKITVTVADQQTPIIVLFGPPSCGKTMTLIRMTRYLSKQGYQVVPIRTFRPASDSHYKAMCDGFDEMINSNDAATSTNRISFMLVEVIRNGRPLCQILEAPGEYYFDPANPNRQFPVYVNKIIACNNRKIWTIFVEPDWSDPAPRQNYVTKINRLKSKMRTSDKTIFIYNKIDLTPLVISPGHVYMNEALKSVNNLYPNIFTPFKNQNPITKIFKKYNCDFVPFQTGEFNESTDGTTYVEGPDEYPKMLWNKWLKLIQG